MTRMAEDRVADMYARQVDLVEHDLVGLAGAMPADTYDFRPTAGEFAGVRTFGEQVKHAATMIFMTAAIVLQEKSPYGPGTNDNGPSDVQGKAQIVAYLEDSIRYARKAMASLTENEPSRSAETSSARSRVAVAAGRGVSQLQPLRTDGGLCPDERHRAASEPAMNPRLPQLPETEQENARLRTEIQRLRQDNDDLRASAQWWIRLYESALQRANSLEEWLMSPEEATRASRHRYEAWLASRSDRHIQSERYPAPEPRETERRANPKCF